MTYARRVAKYAAKGRRGYGVSLLNLDAGFPDGYNDMMVFLNPSVCFTGLFFGNLISPFLRPFAPNE